MLKVINLFVFLILFSLFVNGLEISEIMYDFEGSDNNQEYVELIDVVDLTNYTLEDLTDSDELDLLQDKGTSMALIVEEGFDLSGIDVTVYTTGATIGNNLNNEGDLIILKNSEGVIVEAVSYDDDMGADGNGMSLCRLDDMILRECIPTPGKDNEEENVVYDYTGLRINEFLANPLGNESEWVELYYDGEEVLDLNGLVLEDLEKHQVVISNTNVESGNTIIETGDYLVVNFDITFLNDGDFEEIYLKDGEDVIDSVSYSTSTEDLSWSYYYLGWFEDWATKGEENVFEEEVEYDYSVLEITEFMANPSGDDDAEMPGGEWIELYNSGNESIDVTGLVLKDSSGHRIYISDMNVEDVFVDGGEYIIIYMNGFYGFLNNDELEMITLMDGGDVVDEVSYGFSSEAVSWSKSSDGWIQSMASKGGENVYDEESLETVLDIKEVYVGSDEKTKFGEYVRIKVEIFKGDTDKYNVEAYILDGDEQISKTSKISVYSKFINYSLVIPVNMPDNCDGLLEDGFYTVVVEGLGEMDEEIIDIEGIDDDSCTEVSEECEAVECGESVSYYEESYGLESNINEEEIPLTSLTIFESVGEKSTDVGKYMFIVLLIFLLVVKIKWLKK